MATDPLEGGGSGVFIPLSSIDPTTATRRYAATAYWKPVQSRENLHVLTGYTVGKILLEQSSGSSENVEAIGFQYSTSTSGALTAMAENEVILAAGAFNSPKLLELSGIGNTSVLRSLLWLKMPTSART